MRGVGTYTVYSQPLFLCQSGFAGFLRDPASGRLVGGARVTVRSEDGQVLARARTPSNGTFVIHVPEGRYTVSVWHPDYQYRTTAPALLSPSPRTVLSPIPTKLMARPLTTFW